MAKKPERKQKLKVFRTPIGFHDAYVAAPSQKAALEAWGADGNLFAQGIAEQVTDPELMEEPLASPGKVIKRGPRQYRRAFRGPRPHRPETEAETEAEKARKFRSQRPRPKPRPSRDELDAAEHALEKAEKKQRKKLAEHDEKIRDLDRRRRDMQRKHETERDELADKRDRARSAYDRAMEAWRSAS